MQSCNSWFFTKCPTIAQAGDKGAASIPRCKGCTSLPLEDTKSAAATKEFDKKLNDLGEGSKSEGVSLLIGWVGLMIVGVASSLSFELI